MSNSNLGDGISAKNAAWTFDGKEVAHSFDTHVKKSVPLYKEGQEMIVRMSDFFIDEFSNIFDIGCSTGVLTRKLSKRHAHKSAKVIGIDTSAEMIKIARESTKEIKCEYLIEDAAEVEMHGSDLITAYYTVQFVRPHKRQQLIDKIYADLRWGGAFFMFEKVRACDARFQDIISTTYIEYKQGQGYSDEEILGKQMSLKGILEPFSTEGNIEMLTRAGFKDITTIFKYAPFEGFLCVK
jgi:tRNA (cmo5U34)-methyltransferase